MNAPDDDDSEITQIRRARANMPCDDRVRAIDGYPSSGSRSVAAAAALLSMPPEMCDGYREWKSLLRSFNMALEKAIRAR